MRLRRLAAGLTLFVQGLDTAAWEGRGIADLFLAWRDVQSNVFHIVSTVLQPMAVLAWQDVLSNVPRCKLYHLIVCVWPLRYSKTHVQHS